KAHRLGASDFDEGRDRRFEVGNQRGPDNLRRPLRVVLCEDVGGRLDLHYWFPLVPSACRIAFWLMLVPISASSLTRYSIRSSCPRIRRKFSSSRLTSAEFASKAGTSTFTTRKTTRSVGSLPSALPAEPCGVWNTAATTCGGTISAPWRFRLLPHCSLSLSAA